MYRIEVIFEYNNRFRHSKNVSLIQEDLNVVITWDSVFEHQVMKFIEMGQKLLHCMGRAMLMRI